ncbi:MAG: hypothetical protein C7B46_19575 [Sulfobacillus benefaciens]|uniref:CobQ/CobB/MinD/ParA nucleotide binding domain-containing protein n=1 Tax=Sulfobacillus benefaciens TaxID=453960 RepID=A0A2T2WY30_9FIRM|nr:MAG: hypothetical protein C7B46_19575 [Sulfobacillus benefaciens]
MATRPWHIIIAVDAESNPELKDWVQMAAGEGVSGITTIESAGDLPVVLTAHKGEPVAILATTTLDGLGTWGDTWAAVGQQRAEPTRCLLLAEGTLDGTPGRLGSLASSTLVTWAQVIEGQVTADKEIEYDYDAIGRQLWGEESIVNRRKAPAPVSTPVDNESAVTISDIKVEVTKSGLLSHLLNKGGRSAQSSKVSSPHPPVAAPSVAKATERVILPPSQFVVVVGGKGGVGKTTVAAALLSAAAQAYGGGLGLDLDYLKPNLALHFWDINREVPDLGLLFEQIEMAREQPGGSDPEVEKRWIKDWMVQLFPLLTNGLIIVPGPDRNRLHASLPPRGIPSVLLEWATAQNEPLVVCDTDPAMDESAQTAVEWAGQSDGRIVLVTTPEYDAVLETNRVRHQLIDGFGFPADQLYLIVNHRGSPKSDISAQDIANIHLNGVPLLAELPWVPHAATSALSHHHPIQSWGKKVRWDQVLMTLTGRTPTTKKKRAK